MVKPPSSHFAQAVPARLILCSLGEFALDSKCRAKRIVRDGETPLPELTLRLKLG
jgi:hypothetical protein